MLRLIAKTNIVRLEKELAACGDADSRAATRARLERARRYLLAIEAGVVPERAGSRPARPIAGGGAGG